MKKKQEQDQVVFVDKANPTVEYATNGEFALLAAIICAIVSAFSLWCGYKLAKQSQSKLEDALVGAANRISQQARDDATRAKPVWLGIGDGEATRWYKISEPNWHIDKTIESLTRVRSYVGDDPKNAPTNNWGWLSMGDKFGHGRWVAEEGVTEFSYPVQTWTPTATAKYTSGGWILISNCVITGQSQ